MVRLHFEENYMDALARSFIERELGATDKLLAFVHEDLSLVVRRVMGWNHPGWPDALSRSFDEICKADPAKIRFQNPAQRPWPRVLNWAKCIAQRAAIRQIKIEAQSNTLSFDEDLDSQLAHDPISSWEDSQIDDKSLLDEVLKKLSNEQRSLIVLVLTKRAAEEAAGRSAQTTVILREIAEVLGCRETEIQAKYYAARKIFLSWLPVCSGRVDAPDDAAKSLVKARL